MKLKFIIDPTARRLEHEKTWIKTQEIFAKAKIDYDFEKTEGPGHATPLAKKAVESGYDAIVAVGGDGMANEVLNGMAGSSATLGIIPCGEGNDFIKMINLFPKFPEEACKLIIEGHKKRIDIGIVNGRYFLNVVGTGLAGDIAERKSRSPKYVSGFYAYLFQMLPALLSFKPQKVRIKSEGLDFEENVLLLSIGNGKYSGGGFMLTPGAELDDGWLDVCVAGYISKLRVLQQLPKVPKGKHINEPEVKMFKTKEILFESDSPILAHIDGEVDRAQKYQIKILPQKLKIFAKTSR